MDLGSQIVALFLLALPVASIAWTVTHEDIFRELREYAKRRSETARTLPERKFFYLFTCEYCFSHYVTAFLLAVTRYKLLYDDWRGYLVAGFALVYLANFYMALFARAKLGVKRERVELEDAKQSVEERKQRPSREREAA